MSNSHPEPNPLSMLPFAALLLTIAIAPVLLRESWRKQHAKICAGFAALTVFYYVFALGSGSRVGHAGLEYASFIIVVGAFFVTAGGIHLQGRGSGTPAFNTAFLFGGALLGNGLGTVRASRVLIRAWVALTRNRFVGFHHVFFFFAATK